MDQAITPSDFDDICRLCLQRDGTLRSIFDSGTGKSTIFVKIRHLIDKEIHPTDGLPKYICEVCTVSLSRFSVFRKRSLQSIDVLKSIILSNGNVTIKKEENNSYDEEEADEILGNSDVPIQDEIFNRQVEVKIEEVSDYVPLKKRGAKGKSCKISNKIEKRHDWTSSDDGGRFSDDSDYDPIEDLTKNKDVIDDILDDENDVPIKKDRRSCDIIAYGDEGKRKSKNKTKKKTCKSKKSPKEPKEPKEPRKKKSPASKSGICPVCGISTAHLGMHMYTHTDEKAFACDECEKTFKTKVNLRAHKSFIHQAQRIFKCDKCPFTFKSVHILNRHLKSHDENAKTLVCDICGQRFYLPFALRKHTLTHTQVRNHECKYCGMKFTTKGGLATHLPKHTGEKPFPCGICPLSFAYTSTAAKHRRVHMRNKNFICDICDGEYTNIRMFKAHREEAHGIVQPKFVSQVSNAPPVEHGDIDTAETISISIVAPTPAIQPNLLQQVIQSSPMWSLQRISNEESAQQQSGSQTHDETSNGQIDIVKEEPFKYSVL